MFIGLLWNRLLRRVQHMAASTNMPVPFINGDEEDALTGAKRFFRWRPGEWKRIKRGYWRRVRRTGKLDLGGA